jgi:rhamnogalacturonyl hydrolase YesR
MRTTLRTICTIVTVACCEAHAAAIPACATSSLTTTIRHTRHDDAQATLNLMSRVADWQIAHPVKRPGTDWTCGALYSGLTRFALISPDGRFLDHIRSYGTKHQWQLGSNKRFFADDMCIGQTWVDIHRIDHTPEQLTDMLAVMNDFLTRPTAAGDMKHENKQHLQRWTWCDALFMAPPLLAKLFADTKDPKWEDAMLREYEQTVNFLLDPAESLFYRDHTFFAKKEANGAKVFWSRGNGWVFAGLANILRELPPDAKSRPYFVDLFKRMATRLASLQQPDGSWHASLLDPASFPVPETSGTGFFTYGFAWGLNNGILEESLARPVIEKAWARLVSSVEPDGKLGYVQPIGADPRSVTRDMTENYGVGAFLLAGTEVWQMQLRKVTPASGPHVATRIVSERSDDLSFENDRIAGRFYSQKLAAAEPAVGAIDVWSKNCEELVTKAWYERKDYHTDHGQGGDFYDCRGTLGGGGPGYLTGDGTLIPSPAHSRAIILHQSTHAAVFELEYPEVAVGGCFIKETRRGVLLAGSNALSLTSRFSIRGDSAGIRVVAALTTRQGAQTLDQPGLLLQWEKAGGQGDHGFIGIAVRSDDPKAPVLAAAGYRLLEVGTLNGGAAWSSASTWSKSPATPDFAAWKQLIVGGDR